MEFWKGIRGYEACVSQIRRQKKLEIGNWNKPLEIDFNIQIRCLNIGVLICDKIRNKIIQSEEEIVTSGNFLILRINVISLSNSHKGVTVWIFKSMLSSLTIYSLCILGCVCLS
jgi:hypothetical protein